MTLEFSPKFFDSPSKKSLFNVLRVVQVKSNENKSGRIKIIYVNRTRFACEIPEPRLIVKAFPSLTTCCLLSNEESIKVLFFCSPKSLLGLLFSAVCAKSS